MIPALIFLSSFALYLRTCASYVAPYRDAGEMVSLLGTFGVAHPPGYPLYTLIGRVVVMLPFGCLPYRAAFFSALCAAGAAALFYRVLREWFGRGTSLITVAFLVFSNPFWELASVQEMYALGVLWFALILYAVFVQKNAALFAFVMALGLGVRMDMLLLVPLFAFWLWRKKLTGNIAVPVGFFALGGSVFLYLMVRSHTDPLIDWGNPDTLLAVFNSASRKSYSNTLDLLSLSYAKGENFPVNIKLFVTHLVSSFGWWGTALAALGVWAAFKKNRGLALFFGVIFLVTGPVFLFLANMPPNPHAVAIVEASYLIPDLLIVCFIGFAVDFLFQTKIRPVAAAAAVVGLCLNSAWGYARADKRGNFYSRDFVENALRSAPPHAIAVFQKDVQLFTLWEAQLVERRRPDVTLISKGLSGSPWYWDMHARWKTATAPEISLKEASGWRRLKIQAAPRPLVIGYDVDWTGADGLRMTPQGLMFAATDTEMVGPAWLLSKILLYRGTYIYGETSDFFSTDLIGDHARAHHQQGFNALSQGRLEEAEWFFKRCEAMDPTFARATSDRGYISFLKKDFAGAYEMYRRAAQKSEAKLKLAGEYKSLPNVVDSCKFDLSAMYTQQGAASERLGRVEEAKRLYVTSLNIQESAQAHYNLAVTYWGKDWNQVMLHMRRAVELNPQMNEARVYLAKAQMMAGQKQ